MKLFGADRAKMLSQIGELSGSGIERLKGNALRWFGSDASAVDTRASRISDKFYPNLESLRGIASLSVVFIHCIGAFLTINQATGFGEVLIRHFFGAVNGRNAVVLFFVLSGFVLSQSLSRMNDSFFRTYGRFIAKRAFRILPLAYAVLLISFVYLRWYGPGIPLSTIGRGWLLVGYFRPRIADLVNTLLFVDYRMNGVYWTLYIEILGSLAMPLLFVVSKSVGALGNVFVLALLVFASFAAGTSFLFPQFFFCFYVGGICFLLREWADRHATAGISAVVTPIVLAALGLYILAYVHSTLGDVLYAVTDVRPVGAGRLWVQLPLESLGAAVLIFACSAPRCRVLEIIFGNQMLRGLGRISYSLYAVHLIVLKAIFPLIALGLGGVLFEAPLLGPTLALLTVVPISIALAAIAYRYIERPGIALGRWASTRIMHAHALQHPSALSRESAPGPRPS